VIDHPMAEYVLDTHTLVFALATPGQLGPAARKALTEVEAGRAVAWIPAAVAAEIVILKELGRIGVGLPELTSAMEQASGLRFLPLTLKQLEEFSAHTAIRDPFDRLILSAARSAGAILLTRDRKLRDCGLVRTLWK